MSDNAPRYDVETKSYIDHNPGNLYLGAKTHKTTVRDNQTGKTVTGTSNHSPEKSRGNAFKKL